MEAVKFIEEMSKLRVAVVVAHPDDECLFFGNLISRLQVDLYCCMVAYQEPPRFNAFFRVCKKVKARPEVLYWFDFEWMDLSQYDVVFTHNYVGEYGHPKHRLVHQHVASNHGHVYMSGVNLDHHDVLLSGQEKIELVKTYDFLVNGVPRWKLLLKNYSPLDLENETYVRV